jgi:NTE family protein
VLGAGGIVGQAYHAGVLAAIEEHTGWDPRTADLVVGSSAGSLTGASLRIGVPTRDLFAAAVGEPLSDEGGFLAALAEDGPDITPYEPGKLLRRWRAPTRDLVTRTIRRPWAFRPSVAAITLLPPGWVDLTDLGDALTPFLDVPWPPGLWICAVRRDDGARVVFGRPGAPEAPVGRAVAASCAIPTYFAPVEINGHEYVDGGVHSPTNADVLRREQLDLVIVSSPMSAAHGRARTPGAGIRWAMHRRLERELARLRKAGTTVVRFEPGQATLAAMGMNAMDDTSAAPAARAAKASTLRRLADPGVTERLAILLAATSSLRS